MPSVLYTRLFLTRATDDEGTPPIEVDKNCRLLGPTALVVQGLMGVFVIASLVYKRQREKSKRPWNIWSFDVSKQVAGQIVVHMANLLISGLAAHRSSSNPCIGYFLNVLVDTTLGVGIIYLFLRLYNFIIITQLELPGFESGVYGDPPSISFWTRQTIVYVSALVSMKFCVILLFAIFPWLFEAGEWLLSWTGSKDAVQVIFVMGIFPIAMNVLQFWLIDSIVKFNAVNVFSGNEDDPEARQPLVAPSPYLSDQEDDEGESSIPHGPLRTNSRTLSPQPLRLSNEIFTSDDSLDYPPPSPDNKGSSAELPAIQPESKEIRRRSPPPSPSPSPSAYGATSESPKREDWDWDDDDERGWQGHSVEDSTPNLGPRKASTKETTTRSSEAWRLPTLSPPPKSPS